VASASARPRRSRIAPIAILRASVPVPEAAAPAGPREVALDALWLAGVPGSPAYQPRDIVPEEELRRLIDAGRAQPRPLLERLEEIAAADPYYRDVLARLRDLASSVAARGVLQPIQVLAADGRHVVLDGHRRCLAALLAGRETIPFFAVDEPSEAEATAHALIVNVQREDLTAIEKAKALLHLALLVGQQLAGERGGQPVTAEALIGEVVEETDGANPPAGGYSRPMVAAVRDRVCAEVGIQPRTYYRLLALNRLTTAARKIGLNLPEAHLLPVARLAPADQPAILAFAVQQGLSAREVGRLVDICHAQGRDAVERVMARMQQEQRDRQHVRRRPLASWHALFNAVPRDLHARARSLRTELRAVPDDQRRDRLAILWEQYGLLNSLRTELEDIFQEHDYGGPGQVETAAGGD
jgi:hypothetical protein